MICMSSHSQDRGDLNTVVLGLGYPPEAKGRHRAGSSWELGCLGTTRQTAELSSISLQVTPFLAGSFSETGLTFWFCGAILPHIHALDEGCSIHALIQRSWNLLLTMGKDCLPFPRALPFPPLFSFPLCFLAHFPSLTFRNLSPFLSTSSHVLSQSWGLTWTPLTSGLGFWSAPLFFWPTKQGPNS